jgi:hypothetical protein
LLRVVLGEVLPSAHLTSVIHGQRWSVVFVSAVLEQIRYLPHARKIELQCDSGSGFDPFITVELAQP